tara:strand:+ start:133 stop:834 length:702 start_codon:yes stop_codon:yes gene_type:complete
MFVVISELRPFGATDKHFIRSMEKLTAKCEWLDLEKVIYKGNVGRDFSSVLAGLKEVDKMARDEDEVMIRNRSAYGPFHDGWFLKYSRLLGSGNLVGLTGNTINLSGHPEGTYEENQNLAHVQTYLYLSKVGILRKLMDDFPGVEETERLDLINKGEIRLSQRIMDMGYAINCLKWPDTSIKRGEPIDSRLPKDDKKHQFLDLPFEHRRSKIKYPSRWVRLVWRFLAFIPRKA